MCRRHAPKVAHLPNVNVPCRDIPGSCRRQAPVADRKLRRVGYTSKPEIRAPAEKHIVTSFFASVALELNSTCILRARWSKTRPRRRPKRPTDFEGNCKKTTRTLIASNKDSQAFQSTSGERKHGKTDSIVVDRASFPKVKTGIYIHHTDDDA